MTAYKVVVDGSNIATEGRSLPSLGQLDEAVRAFMEEHPQADVLVIVDTTFAHRISTAEQPLFEAAYAAGEIICPPAGTIGRGDSFILKVADKLGATIFSNDSFQEFHGEYAWLFEKGRLLGGKPVPGLGWVFMDRTPVRGPKSRESVRDAKRTKARVGSREASQPMPIPRTPPPFVLAKTAAPSTQSVIAEVMADPDPDPRKGKKHKGRDRDKNSDLRHPERAERATDKEQRKAEKAARQDADRASGQPLDDGSEGSESARRKRRRKKGRPVEAGQEPINESLVFITFIAEHTIGSEVAGVVDSYSSHGFYVVAAGARCYVPLTGLADPVPRSAKEVVQRGEQHQWIVRSFDPPRRGIEVALVGSPAASAPLQSADSADDGDGDSRAVAAPGPGPVARTRAGRVSTPSDRPRRSARGKPATVAEAPQPEPQTQEAASVPANATRKPSGAAKGAGAAKASGARKAGARVKATAPAKAAVPAKAGASIKAASHGKAGATEGAVAHKAAGAAKTASPKAVAPKAVAPKAVAAADGRVKEAAKVPAQASAARAKKAVGPAKAAATPKADSPKGSAKAASAGRPAGKAGPLKGGSVEALGATDVPSKARPSKAPSRKPAAAKPAAAKPAVRGTASVTKAAVTKAGAKPAAAKAPAKKAGTAKAQQGPAKAAPAKRAADSAPGRPAARVKKS